MSDARPCPNCSHARDQHVRGGCAAREDGFFCSCRLGYEDITMPNGTARKAVEMETIVVSLPKGAFADLLDAARLATRRPWRWWTSNSHYRLSSDESGKDGDVLSAVVARDGLPEVRVLPADANFIAEAVRFADHAKGGALLSAMPVHQAIEFASDAHDLSRENTVLEAASFLLGLGHAKLSAELLAYFNVAISCEKASDR